MALKLLHSGILFISDATINAPAGKSLSLGSHGQNLITMSSTGGVAITSVAGQAAVFGGSGGTYAAAADGALQVKAAVSKQVLIGANNDSQLAFASDGLSASFSVPTSANQRNLGNIRTVSSPDGASWYYFRVATFSVNASVNIGGYLRMRVNGRFKAGEISMHLFTGATPSVLYVDQARFTNYGTSEFNYVGYITSGNTVQIWVRADTWDVLRISDVELPDSNFSANYTNGSYQTAAPGGTQIVSTLINPGLNADMVDSTHIVTCALADIGTTANTLYFAY